MIARIAALTCAAVISACAPGPNYVQPQFGVPDAYSTPLASKAALEDVWWHGFDDPQLNIYVEAALKNNLTVEIAQANLEAALAGITASRSDFFPTLDAGAVGFTSFDLSGADSDSVNFGNNLNFGSNSSSSVRGNGSIGGTLTPDLNGRLRRQLEAVRAVAASQGYSVRNAQRLAASATAQTYIELKRTRARLQLLDRSLELQNQTLDIVKARRRAGLSAELDVQRAASDLARTRAQRGILALAEASARFTIALLLGEAPAGLVIPEETDTQVPVYGGAPFIALPADILRSRPDVLAAEADLMAATARIGIQKADLYPSLSIPGSIGGSLGEGGSIISNAAAIISAAIDIPLLDAGRRRAEVRAAQADTRAALATYELALLTSYREIETALVSVQSFRDRQADLTIAVTASEAAFEQLNALYKEGLATFIDILDAQRTLIASRESFVDSEAALATAYIDLYETTGAPTMTADGAGR